MALINDSLGFIYLFEPHTGSRSVKDALLTLHGSKTASNHHAGILELVKDRSIPRGGQHNFKFICTVRNPFDTLVTKWARHPRRRQPDFLSFVNTEIETDVVKLPSLGLWNEARNIIWFEHLQKDFKQLFDLELPTVNPAYVTSDKKPWNEYYEQDNKVTFNKIFKRYKGYCERFGYEYHWDDDGKLTCEVCDATRCVYLGGQRGLI